MSQRRIQRVLMTADTVGGVWTFALDLSRGLASQGVEVALATMGPGLTLEQRVECREVPSIQVFESNYKLEWMDDPWCDVEAAGWWLLDLERRIEPDVIHLNGYCHAALPFRAPVLVTGHSCVLSWWQAVRGVPAPPQWDHYANQVRAGLQSAAIVTAPTAAMMDLLLTYYGPLKATCIIPNCTEDSTVPTASKEPFLFAAGRIWDEAKNLAAVNDIAGCLSWPVYVAGETRHPQGHVQAGENVQLLGRLSRREVSAWMERASIYLLPARYEPFGLSALEAGMRGCALVLGNIPSLREVWGEAACFVPPDDRTALLAGASELILNQVLRIEMGRRARARAGQFSLARLTDGYLAAYSAAR